VDAPAYPTLVAIGTAEDGAAWLLDLEAASVLHLQEHRVWARRVPLRIPGSRGLP
jgi:hypothetical protein